MSDSTRSSSTVARRESTPPRPSIALRIAWTSGRLKSSDAKVLLALASCGDWETGTRCFPLWRTLVTRSGLSRATVARTLVRLEDPSRPGGPWIIATSRRHRRATTYDICVDRLATAPSKEQQTTMMTTLTTDLLSSSSPPNLESHFETLEILESHFETLTPSLESHFETPICSKDLSVRTHTPRAREESQEFESQNETQTAGNLPLVGATPPPRCAHPYKHAWCAGRVHVPKDLHFEFLARLDTRPGESREAKAGRLVAFYASVNATLPADQPIGEEPFKFWWRRFAAAFAMPAETSQRSLRGRVPLPATSQDHVDAVNQQIEIRRRRGEMKAQGMSEGAIEAIFDAEYDERQRLKQA